MSNKNNVIPFPNDMARSLMVSGGYAVAGMPVVESAGLMPSCILIKTKDNPEWVKIDIDKDSPEE